MYDKEARDLFIELRKKCKSPEEIGKAIDKAIDRYFEFKSQYVFSKRVNCARNGIEEEFKQSSAVCYAWFVWEKGYSGKPAINWI